ncbi:hypothetical protein PMAYCL1PPCAC_30313, partial [Pristionchus mayeri]
QHPSLYRTLPSVIAGRLSLRMFISRLGLSFTVGLSLLSCVSALSCYVNDKQGNVHLRSDPKWSFCSLIPFTSEGTGRLYGVGAANEDISGIQAAFAQSTSFYSVKALCLYERYNTGALSGLFKIEPEDEFKFRCFCNTDKCNQETTFAAFLAGMRQ